MLSAAAIALHGRFFGFDLASPAASASLPPSALDDASVAFASTTAQSPLSIQELAVFITVLLAAILPLIFKSRTLRTAILVLDIFILGFLHCEFLSISRLVGWVANGFPSSSLALATVIVLLCAAFLFPAFGKRQHYCLNICPFGASQELAGRLLSRKPRISTAAIRRLESFRRLIFAVLMISLWCNTGSRWIEWEPFSAFAWRVAPPIMIVTALAFLALSIFIPRAYCRFACPTGSLLKIASERNP